LKAGDLARLKKAHFPDLKRNSRRDAKERKWAQTGAPLLLLEKSGWPDARWEVLTPSGELASFDDHLLTTRGMK